MFPFFLLLTDHRNRTILVYYSIQGRRVTRVFLELGHFNKKSSGAQEQEVSAEKKSPFFSPGNTYKFYFK